MYICLLIINFIIILFIIKFAINKLSKFILYKLNIQNKDKDINNIKKIQYTISNIIIFLNLGVLFCGYYLNIQTSLFIGVIALIDVVAVISLGISVKLKNNLSQDND